MCKGNMWNNVIVLAVFLQAASALWSCSLDTECADVVGAVCRAGVCACASGQQVIGGECVDLAVYHTAACVEDHQCSRLFVAFECRKEGDAQEGVCHCQDDFHYFHGRCWRSAGFGAACSQDEECIDAPRDPYSLSCAGTCVCADGYYLRQRGECRKIGYAVGDGCVLDEDCQFANGACDLQSLSCGLSTGRRISNTTSTSPLNVTVSDVTSHDVPRNNVTSYEVSRNDVTTHGSACPCAPPFECQFDSCVCPLGYYGVGNSDVCYAELGSPSTEEQCFGLLAEVVDGACVCPPNFFYEHNMRDCVKVTRIITDACTSDDNCLTFGVASVCGPPDAAAWGQRACLCDADRAVWDATRQMCRLFAGVSEACEVDSDCLAGELEIQCVYNEQGEGRCTCPEGLLTVDGLCLTSGLAIGDVCQSSAECTETPNTGCFAGVCACDGGYQQDGDFCAPIIGGTCEQDSDCVIENTVCHNGTNAYTCQCDDSYVAYNEACWAVSQGFEGACNHTIQCTETIGANSQCISDRCVCDGGYHFRDGSCWPVTGLFEGCSRTSQCYLSQMSERVVCRNSLCQCDFDYPYSEAEHTCVSFAPSAVGSIFMIMSALFHLVLS